MVVRVRIIKKFARYLNGVDLDPFQVGACVEFPIHVADMLIREGWAQLPERDCHSGEMARPGDAAAVEETF